MMKSFRPGDTNGPYPTIGFSCGKRHSNVRRPLLPSQSKHAHGMNEFWEQPDVVARFSAREPDERLLDLMQEFEDPAATRVLDLGCAGGRNTVALAERGFDVVAIDTSQAMVEHVRKRLTPLVGERTARQRVLLGRMDDLSFLPSATVHLIAALGVYHNADSGSEWDGALAESARVLAPLGKLLVAVFTPRTDLTGEGVQAVKGETHLYEGFPSGRAWLVEAETMDAEARRFGLVPVQPSTTVTAPTELGRRVTVNALYQLSSQS